MMTKRELYRRVNALAAEFARAEYHRLKDEIVGELRLAAAKGQDVAAVLGALEAKAARPRVIVTPKCEP